MYAECSPARNSILQWTRNFHKHGRIENAQASGKTAASFHQEKRVSCYFLPYPSRFSRGAEQVLAVSWRSVLAIPRNRLHLFPYKLRVVEQLEENDYKARRKFANWCLQNTQVDASFLSRVIYSKECFLHVDGKFDKHNVKICGT